MRKGATGRDLQLVSVDVRVRVGVVSQCRIEETSSSYLFIFVNGLLR
jgi:hypothetical protein